MLLKCSEIPIDIDQRVLQGAAQTLQRGQYGPGSKTQDMREELIRMLDLDTIGGSDPFREVLEVLGHDDIGTATNGSGEHMAVIGVRQGERGYEVLEVLDERIPRMRVHEISGPLKLRTGEIRSIGENRPNPFLVNLIRPTRSVKVRERQMHEDIAKGRRIEHARIIERGECHNQYPRPNSCDWRLSSFNASSRFASSIFL